MKANRLLIAYTIAALLCLAGRLAPAPYDTVLDYVSKPLLIPLLYGYFWLSTDKAYSHLFFISSGMLFAWWGDLFLMIAHDNQFLFILGLLSFLLMQLLYIAWYGRFKDKKQNIFAKYIYWALPSCLIGGYFYSLLYPELDSLLKVAVGCYALALIAMTLAAINRWGQCSRKSFWLATIGAFSFMFSDMMIGYNNFLQEFWLAGFWIMLTYAGGQFLIIQGLVSYHQQKNRHE